MNDIVANALGGWSQSLGSGSILFRIGLTLVLSAIIGCERSTKRHSAGLRTFMVVSLAATVTMLLDLYLTLYVKPDYFVLSAAAIVSVAVISVRSLLTSSRNQIKGLTTAAALWASCIVGLSSGAGMYTVTIAGFFVLVCCLSWFPSVEHYLKNRSNHFEIHLELKDSHYLQNFVSTIRRLGLTIDDIEKNPAYAHSGLSVYTISISVSSAELKKYKTHKEIIEALRSLNYIHHIEEMVQ